MLFSGFFNRLSSPFSSGVRKREAGGAVAPRTPGISYDQMAAALALWGGTSPMAVSTVYRCVRFLCESVAQLPLQLQRRRGEVFVNHGGSPADERLRDLLTIEPSEGMSIFDMLSRAVADMLLHGNAYALPQYSDMLISRLVLLSPMCVSYDKDTRLYAVDDSAAGVKGTFREADIINIANFTTDDPRVGRSVIAHARATFDIAGLSEAEARNRIANGGMPKGIITSSSSGVSGWGELQDKELAKVAKDLRERLRTEGIVEATGQIDYKQIGMSNTDMEFLASRKFTVREICRFFGVHPSFVFDDTSNNYKSAEMANVAFLSNTLNPLLRKIELELQRKLVPRGLRGKRRIQFDRRGLYSCDLDGRAKYLSSLLQTGCSVNEVRLLENMAPVEGGDSPLVSANLKTLGEVAPVAEPQPQTLNTQKDDDDKDDK